MSADLLHTSLEIFSGMIVGFTLGLIGGGGSILAVPLMVYLVGVSNPHVALGTSALAVAVNALVGLAQHARAHTVKWRCAGIYAAGGVLGAFAGAAVGKAVNGKHLLLCFAFLMIGVGILMLKGRNNEGCPGASCNRNNIGKVASFGVGTGVLSGFFGIGGGFLIVPGLIASTGMPILNAVGTSLVAVFAFGLSTALSYMVSGYIDWKLAGLFILGGAAGSVLGIQAGQRMAKSKGSLTLFFAIVIFLVALYMIWQGIRSF